MQNALNYVPLEQQQKNRVAAKQITYRFSLTTVSLFRKSKKLFLPKYPNVSL